MSERYSNLQFQSKNNFFYKYNDKTPQTKRLTLEAKLDILCDDFTCYVKLFMTSKNKFVWLDIDKCKAI